MDWLIGAGFALGLLPLHHRVSGFHIAVLAITCFSFGTATIFSSFWLQIHSHILTIIGTAMGASLMAALLGVEKLHMAYGEPSLDYIQLHKRAQS